MPVININFAELAESNVNSNGTGAYQSFYPIGNPISGYQASTQQLVTICQKYIDAVYTVHLHIGDENLASHKIKRDALNTLYVGE